jgi:hypothetical protein
MQDLISFVNLDLDMDILTDIAISSRPLKDLAAHHRLVKDFPYMTQLKNKYPFLSTVFNVYKHPSGYSVPIHIDADRFCAINIPICNTEHSETIFYVMNNDVEVKYDSKRILNQINSGVTECFRFTLLKPTIIDTTKPHSVVNYGSETRIIISWSVLKPMTFQECLVSMAQVI